MEKDVDWEGKMKAVAKLITGFSGREISKLVLAWQVSNLIQSTPLKGISSQGHPGEYTVLDITNAHNLQ